MKCAKYTHCNNQEYDCKYLGKWREASWDPEDPSLAVIQLPEDGEFVRIVHMSRVRWESGEEIK